VADVDLPDGFYLVDDPDCPGKATTWWCRDGKLRDWPEGARWRPLPPKRERMAPRAYKAWQADWYDGPYRDWLRRLEAAIAADVDGARARFSARYPDAVVPDSVVRSGPTRRAAPAKAPRKRPPAKELSRARQQLLEQQLATAVLRSAGQSIAEVGQTLGITKQAAARRLYATPPAGVNAALVLSLLLVRASEVVSLLQGAQVAGLEGVAADRVDRWITGLQEAAKTLRASAGGGDPW
jgi:hypothetical protein